MENEEKEELKQETPKEQPKNKKSKISILIIILTIIFFVSITGFIIAKIFDDDCEEKNYNTYKNNASGLFVDINTQYDDKPIIYLYPTEETEVNVKLGNPEKIICSYPKYIDGWNVIAKPDGTLTYTETGRELYSLYWEGKDANAKVNTEEGFVVRGEDTVSFLEEKLEILGLNSKEAEEFIIYWLPKMESNKYNYIRFATMEEIEEYMPLEVNPTPDTVIRILMEFKGLDEYIEVKEQKLEKAKRSGFAVVEWGGTEIK